MMPVWLKEWWPVLVVLCSLLGPWLTWSMAKKFMTREDCGKCTTGILERVAILEKQKTCVDIRLDQLPQVEALHEIALRQEQLAGQQGTLSAELAGVKELLERIEHPLNLLMEHHLNRRGASS